MVDNNLEENLPEDNKKPMNLFSKNILKTIIGTERASMAMKAVSM